MLLHKDVSAAVLYEHLMGVSERNPPILSAIEERWDALNRAFGREFPSDAYTVRFEETYSSLTKLSSKQSSLSCCATYEKFYGSLEELADITEKVDTLIVTIFKLLSEIEVDCFRRAAQRGCRPE